MRLLRLGPAVFGGLLLSGNAAAQFQIPLPPHATPDLPPGQLGIELDLLCGEHVGRHRHDCGRGGERGHASSPPRHPRGRPIRSRSPGRQLDRQAGRELRQQGAKALAAEGIDVALRRAREVGRRDVRKILAATERAEQELDGRTPVAKILRQRLRAARRPCAPRPRSRCWRARAWRGNPPSRFRARNAGRCAGAGRAAPDRCRARSGSPASPPD